VASNFPFDESNIVSAAKKFFANEDTLHAAGDCDLRRRAMLRATNDTLSIHNWLHSATPRTA